LVKSGPEKISLIEEYKEVLKAIPGTEVLILSISA
jgi:hypothetical protein